MEDEKQQIEMPGLTLDVKKASGGGVVVAAVLPGQSGEKEPAKKEEDAPVVTHHSVTVGGRTLNYTVTTGMMPLKSSEVGSSETEANVFFMAYTLDDAGATARRPLMFSFNGGPGSSSVWLHLGALGPRRVKMLPDGNMPPPPFEMLDNEHTWLDLTDLVFIDPVGTGYSRPAKPELGKKFWGMQGDIDSVGEFIRLYLTKHQRWSSPLFLVGESYGTTRAAGLAGSLIEKGIAFNGIVLVSTILNFQTADAETGNDLPYLLYLPTYTATAWYHGKLDKHLQADLRRTLDEVEEWAVRVYTVALAKGDGLSREERDTVCDRLARYTGLSKRYVEQMDLRIEIIRFCKELLRDERETVGRLDSRIKGSDRLASSEQPDFDPSMAAIRPPYTAVFNNYVRQELGYHNDEEYYILGGGIKSPWEWGPVERGYPDTSESLRSAFAKNPYMKLLVAYGYYDLATPYFAAKYTLSHMSLDAKFKANVTVADYEAGHMMYIHDGSLVKLKEDVSKFITGALPEWP